MKRAVESWVLSATVLGGVVLCSTAASAAEVAAFDRGFYGSFGGHTPANLGYSVGDTNVGNSIARNFFAFDLSTLSSTVVAAELRINAGFFASPDPFETYELYDVTTPFDLLFSGEGKVDAWNDLGSGIVYGSRNVSAADQET